jgi:hypothetical protein
MNKSLLLALPFAAFLLTAAPNQAAAQTSNVLFFPCTSLTCVIPCSFCSLPGTWVASFNPAGGAPHTPWEPFTGTLLFNSEKTVSFQGYLSDGPTQRPDSGQGIWSMPHSHFYFVTVLQFDGQDWWRLNLKIHHTSQTWAPHPFNNSHPCNFLKGDYWADKCPGDPKTCPRAHNWGQLGTPDGTFRAYRMTAPLIW